MSYYNLIDLYLVDNENFNHSISDLSDVIKRKEDLCFFSHYKDWLTDRFADIIKRSQTDYKYLQFLTYYPLDEQGMYFIIEPKEIPYFNSHLDHLMDWVIQDEICVDDYKDEMLKMISTVNFENYEIWDMYGSLMYPYYCLVALRSMTFFASKNNKFVVIHVWEGG